MYTHTHNQILFKRKRKTVQKLMSIVSTALRRLRQGRRPSKSQASLDHVHKIYLRTLATVKRRAMTSS